MLYINKQYENIYLPNYSEAYALQTLLAAVDVALDEDNERVEADNYTCDQFTIVVGGKSIAFVLGGPQADALFHFIHYLAEENCYEVNMKTLEVNE